MTRSGGCRPRADPLMTNRFPTSAMTRGQPMPCRSLKASRRHFDSGETGAVGTTHLPHLGQDSQIKPLHANNPHHADATDNNEIPRCPRRRLGSLGSRQDSPTGPVSRPRTVPSVPSLHHLLVLAVQALQGGRARGRNRYRRHDRPRGHAVEKSAGAAPALWTGGQCQWTRRSGYQAQNRTNAVERDHNSPECTPVAKTRAILECVLTYSNTRS